ncbi:hypothetical protein [Phycicoccus flavus]|uniref:hypothetical protein n=1 Tax=Phycicoccus flavus TaxID=2502783 RepID=UPI000FEC11BC|nr:hypothetical protein [Phycicoccus flavus]NHA68633.1 hypothetical protein [Phycicoccus flavus]
MTFTIGSQNAGVVNNVDGDQHVTGGQQGTLVTTADAVRTAAELRAALDEAALEPQTAARARQDVDEIDAELHSAPEPDKARVAGALERLARLLKGAGAVATSGAALLGPLKALALWLGALGVPALALLT